MLLLALTVPSSAHAAKVTNLLAPQSSCSGQLEMHVSADRQERTMLCMFNYARERVGASKLKPTPKLKRSALHKSLDILRCQMFSHEACGRDFLYWLERSGYTVGCWAAGENLAWGSGSYGTVRSIMRAWLKSAPHRENILRRDYRQAGLGLEVGNFGSYNGARVWTAHFGVHC